MGPDQEWLQARQLLLQEALTGLLPVVAELLQALWLAVLLLQDAVHG